jgi:diguanylate cyclase (GGDEF)-like protein
VREAISQHPVVVRAQQRPEHATGYVARGVSASGLESVSVTVSIGVAERKPMHRSALDVLRAADKALYRAKQNGRDRISSET